MQGVVLVLSGPSAVGKTSIANELLKNDSKVSRVVTCTTRPIRPGERDGIDYIFLNRESFEERLRAGDFVEYSTVYGNYYGILRQTIIDIVEEGKIPLLLVNWEGYRKIKKVFPDSTCGIFLLPPALEDLEKRIRGRSQDSELVIQKRLSEAEDDMTHSSEFEYQVINADLSVAVEEILRIINDICL